MSKYIYINGEKTKYTISKTGIVKNDLTGKKLAVQTDKDGYEYVQLCHKSKHYNRKIHKLVAEAYIPNPLNKPEIHHKDGNPTNNDHTNLMWCTKKEHFELERERVGKFKRACGESHGSSKYSEETIMLAVRDICDGLTVPEVSEKYGITKSSLYNIISGKGWTHLTNDMELPDLEKYKKDVYDEELKSSIIGLLKEGYSPKKICEHLSIPYTKKMTNYIKTIKRRKIHNKA